MTTNSDRLFDRIVDFLNDLTEPLTADQAAEVVEEACSHAIFWIPKHFEQNIVREAHPSLSIAERNPGMARGVA